MPSRYHPRGKAAIALLTEVSLYGYRLMEINNFTDAPACVLWQVG